MTYLRIVFGLIALSQLALGALTLLAPGFFISSMGLTTPPADTLYLIGMLASRFLVLGVVLVTVLRRPRIDPIWIVATLAIQLVDLAVGLYYTGIGTLPLAVSAFPMFNATLFSVLLLIAIRRPVATAVA